MFKKNKIELFNLSIDNIFSGILFIGDPHLYSLTPGRRLDSCFFRVICEKLIKSAEICQKNNLYPIILGDLLHKENDNNIEMLVCLIKALNHFPVPPLTIVGNHDKKGKVVSEKNTISILIESGLIHKIDESGFVGYIDLVNKNNIEKVAIGGSPYGTQIPTNWTEFARVGSTEEFKKWLGVDKTLWLTHDDLAFEGAYPESTPLFEMNGIDIVVNGHMHGTKQPIKKGKTVWYNPGNITRLSIDMVDHKPSVWEFNPEKDTGMASTTGEKVPLLIQHVLNHVEGKKIFDFTGTHANEILKTSIVQNQTSEFVNLLLNQKNERKTSDAVFISETLLEILKKNKVNNSVKSRIGYLLEKSKEILNKN
jgi:predicted MPP superfamily phosphohydrolase